MRTRPAALFVAALFAAFTSHNLLAQPLVNIETVTVGDAGNMAFSTGNNYWPTIGAVSYEFAIGKYEVTISQYSTFLNSVASVTSNAYIVDLWNARMATDLNIAGISRSGAGILSDPYSYSVIGSGNRPIAAVSWFDAARFANWMNNGANNGASTETGAYTLNGATTGIITKNAGTTWWIPSRDEWYKAGHYKGGGTNAGYWRYPTQSDIAPGNVVGGDNQANYKTTVYIDGAEEPPFYYEVYSVTQSSSYSDTENYLTDVGAFNDSSSPYGTFDQAGNVMEWNDDIGGPPETGDPLWRGVNGGDWSTGEDVLRARTVWTSPREEFVGFRLATVPEPSTYALLLMTGAGALWWARRYRACWRRNEA